jgi:hypothetical protein
MGELGNINKYRISCLWYNSRTECQRKRTTLLKKHLESIKVLRNYDIC